MSDFAIVVQRKPEFRICSVAEATAVILEWVRHTRLTKRSNSVFATTRDGNRVVCEAVPRVMYAQPGRADSIRVALARGKVFRYGVITQQYSYRMGWSEVTNDRLKEELWLAAYADGFIFNSPTDLSRETGSDNWYRRVDEGGVATDDDSLSDMYDADV